MTERSDALFAEILADPRSDAARLVYADHLLERGDPRGELIQLQCRLEKLVPDDPARRPLARRIADLLGVHETAWTRDVRALGFADHLHQVALRRGFVEKVMIGAAQHATIAALRAITPLRHVHVRVPDAANDARRDHDLAALGEAVAGIEALSLHAGGIHARRAFAAALARWPQLARLRELDVDGDEIVQVIAATRTLFGLQRLRVRAPFHAHDALVAARHLATVTTLELPGDRLGAVGVDHLARSGVFGGLTRLVIAGGSFDAAAGRALAAAPFAPNLVQLRVHGNTLGPAGAIAVVARCTALELLDLEATHLGEAGVCAVLAARLPRLRSLDISRNALAGDELASSVASHLQLPALRHLVARATGAGAAAVAAIATAPLLGELRSLELSDNPIGDDGAAALARAPALQALEVLRLAGCGLGARGVRALATGALAPRLRTLDLGRNTLDDDALHALAEGDPLRDLAVLHLDGSRVTARGVAALVASPLAARLEHLAITGLEAGALAPLLAAELPALRSLVADALDDDAAAMLAAARGLPRLHDVVLRARTLTDAGARALADATSLGELAWLELDAPAVTAHGRAWLRARFGHHAGVVAGGSLHAFAALGRRG